MIIMLIIIVVSEWELIDGTYDVFAMSSLPPEPPEPVDAFLQEHLDKEKV